MSPWAKPRVVHADRLKRCYGKTAEDLGFRQVLEPQEVQSEPEPKEPVEGQPESIVDEVTQEQPEAEAEPEPSPRQRRRRSPENTLDKQPDSVSPEPEEPERRTRRGRLITKPARYQDYITTISNSI